MSPVNTVSGPTREILDRARRSSCYAASGRGQVIRIARALGRTLWQTDRAPHARRPLPFPTPAALVDVNMDTLGLGQKQHEALRQLASLSLVYRH